MAIAAGMFDVLDKQVLQGMSSLWSESLHPLFQAIAELGGLELTTLLMLALAIFLLRRGFGADAWVVLVFVAAQVLEVLARTLAVPIATVIIVLVAFDRLYLDVHWESDVLGGLLLGGIGLLAGTIWLDRPLAGEN